LRHMYDLPCNDALNEWKVSLESLAMIYVTADKYQVKSLTENVYHKIRRHVNCQNVTRVEGFLDALEVIITGTTTEDKCVRTTMIIACVKDINKLQKSCGFTALLREHGDIGAEILQHSRLPLMLEGTWYCGDDLAHFEAVPTYRRCNRPFPESYVRSHRHLKTWTCPNCQNEEQAVCMDCGAEDRCSFVKWEWRDESR